MQVGLTHREQMQVELTHRVVLTERAKRAKAPFRLQVISPIVRLYRSHCFTDLDKTWHAGPLIFKLFCRRQFLIGEKGWRPAEPHKEFIYLQFLYIGTRQRFNLFGM